MDRKELDRLVDFFDKTGSVPLKIATAEVILEAAQTRDGPVAFLAPALYQVANGLFCGHPDSAALVTRVRKMADSIGPQATRPFSAYIC